MPHSTWHVVETPWQPGFNAAWETRFTVGNGYLGIRGFPDEPFDAGAGGTPPPPWGGPSLVGTYIAGVFAPDANAGGTPVPSLPATGKLAPPPWGGGIPELVNVTNFLRLHVRLAGHVLRLAPDRVTDYARTLDLRRGILRREFRYRHADRHTLVAIERFACIHAPHLVCQTVEVTPLNWSGTVAVTFWLDSRVRNLSKAHLRLLHARHVARDRILVLTETRHSAAPGGPFQFASCGQTGTGVPARRVPARRIRIGHACRTEAWVHHTRPPEPEHVGTGPRVGLRYTAQLECSQRARFGRTVATYTSRDPDLTTPGRRRSTEAAGGAGTTAVERCCLAAIAPRRPTGRCQFARRGQTGDGRFDRRTPTAWRPGVLRRAHAAAWRRRWDNADIEIDGNDDDQRAVRFAIFQLIQACSSFDPTVSIGAKALSGEAYRGHVFWDTEIFVLPFFIHTSPPAARRLLAYRRHTLPGARAKATADGYQGAMFAWESADTGQETCPLHVPDPKTGEPVPVWCGRIEQHISADVAYGAWHVWQATRGTTPGTDAFRRNVLAPIATETARFWASRVEPDGDAYAIRDVIGPDEYHEHVDNNAFTNYMAAWNLRLAADLAPDDPDAPRWRQIADAIRIPLDHDRGIIAQDDTFLTLENTDPFALSSRVSAEPEKFRMARIWRSQVLKQADVVMLLMLWPHAFPKTLRRACWDYYEPRTTHDSSLSASVHAIVAADLGLATSAYDYFRLTAATDLADPMDNVADGLHAAALGGTWQAVVRGFLGIRTDGDALRIAPHLPRAWRRVTTKVRHRGAQLAIEATHKQVRVEKLSGKGVSTLHLGNHVLCDGTPDAVCLNVGQSTTFRL